MNNMYSGLRKPPPDLTVPLSASAGGTNDRARRAADDAETRLLGSGISALAMLAVLLLLLINAGILTAV
jgi:hypothetical protein